MKYLKRFKTQAQYEEYIESSDFVTPNVSIIDDNNEVHYHPLINYKEIPLTFNITGDGNIVWKAYKAAYTCTIEYSKNGGEWTSITSTTAGTSISVVAGDKVQFRGDNATYSSNYNKYNFFGGTTCSFNVEGNIMSLINSTGFATATTLSSIYMFYNLFYNCTGLTDVSNLVLPATTLTEYCYSQMFYGCTSLVTAPELPATTLASNCYYNMFYGCTSLTTAPELPATTLAEMCYYYMFRGCTSLTIAPELPATTLATYCYNGMFYGCTSLTTAPELPVTTLANSCYGSMFSGCTSLTTAPELPATTLASGCYTSMFYNCTSLTTAPELPATTLEQMCYYYMFYGCTSLNHIKCLATNISATYCTTDWVNGVASTGTFVRTSMADWTIGTSGIPTNWIVQFDTTSGGSAGGGAGSAG